MWASIALPVTMSSAEGQQVGGGYTIHAWSGVLGQWQRGGRWMQQQCKQCGRKVAGSIAHDTRGTPHQVEYLVLDTAADLAEPAVESYLRRLQGERDAEAAAMADAAKDAKQRGEDDWALDPTLLRRMAAVRDAERGLIVQARQRQGKGGGVRASGAWVCSRSHASAVGGSNHTATSMPLPRMQELLYLLTIKRLKETGLTIVTDLGDAAPAGPPRLEAGVAQSSALNSANNAMGKRMEQVRGAHAARDRVTARPLRVRADLPLLLQCVMSGTRPNLTTPKHRAAHAAGVAACGRLHPGLRGRDRDQQPAAALEGHAAEPRPGAGGAPLRGHAGGEPLVTTCENRQTARRLPTTVLRLPCAIRPPVLTASPVCTQFGYFSAGLEAECGTRGIPLGSDSEAMVKVADGLEEDKLKAMCSVQTADGWYSAVGGPLLGRVGHARCAV